jgi:hypothetical protein
MSLISFTALQDGVTSVNSAATNTPLSTIYNDYNGNITDANISASASIAYSKLSVPLALGYAQITSNFTATGAITQVTGLTATVTIPAGGRRVKITAWAKNIQHTTAVTNVSLSIWDGTVGSGTQLADSLVTIPGANYSLPVTVIAVVTPAAGSKTYNVGFTAGSATGTISATTASPAFILVEAI